MKQSREYRSLLIHTAFLSAHSLCSTGHSKKNKGLRIKIMKRLKNELAR